MSMPSLQLELLLTRKERTLEELCETLSRQSGRPIDLTLTRNRVSLVSARFTAAGTPHVRVNRLFLAAPDEVVMALGQYLATRFGKKYGCTPKAWRSGK